MVIEHKYDITSMMVGIGEIQEILSFCADANDSIYGRMLKIDVKYLFAIDSDSLMDR